MKQAKFSRSRDLPTVEQLTAELERENYRRQYSRVLRSTLYTLIVVAAVAVLVATLWMPVLQIYGASMAPTLEEGDIQYSRVLRSTLYTLIVVAAVAVLVATLWMPVLQIYGASMAPTLEEGDIVVCRKTQDLSAGDLVAFYLGNKILVKRCIAGPGQWVDIDENGNVFVDGAALPEPYLTEKSLGQTDLEFPYQVPESRYFCGQWVDIDENGNVFVDGAALPEPYLTEKSLGQTDLEFPYQVPESRYFCMGDHRATSVDSRHTAVGCVGQEQLVGKILFRVWPLGRFGAVT